MTRWLLIIFILLAVEIWVDDLISQTPDRFYVSTYIKKQKPTNWYFDCLTGIVQLCVSDTCQKYFDSNNQLINCDQDANTEKM